MRCVDQATKHKLNSAFSFNRILHGNAPNILGTLPDNSVDLSFWSPPYFLGKSYEKDLSFDDWKKLISDTIAAHFRIIKDGGFLAINIADILCFPDENMPQFQANNLSGKKCPITKADILKAKLLHPDFNRYQLAEILGCSEQTVQRRLEDNNVRGGKSSTPTKIVLTGCLVERWSESVGFYLYDKRVWHKDPCWANSQWHSNSYRAVDEFEHVYIFWKPGITDYDRTRLEPKEWSDWGSRGVWKIKSVKRNEKHEAEFPIELPERVIRIFSSKGDVVIDPFIGTGTTALAAKNLGRQWLGIDNSKKSVKLAQSRLK